MTKKIDVVYQDNLGTVVHPPYRYPTAFCKWVLQESKDDLVEAARIIHHTLASNPRPSNLVWRILEATGHRLYNLDAFMVAAENVLNEGKKSK